MNLNHALQLISTFSNDFSEGINHQHELEPRVQNSASLVNDNHKALPKELTEYIDRICPKDDMVFEGVGHPVELLKISDLSFKPSMYEGLTGDLGEWQDDWFLIAHEGGDPIIVKTSEQGETSTVYSAMQGMGYWDFAPIADSIGQFLLCVCAIQHALNFPAVQEPLDDDFNLAPAAANWLFPLLRQHAGAHYEEWASVFENYI